MTQRFVGKVAIVTGGGSGLGAETARRLAAEGAATVITGRRLDKLESVADEIRAADGLVATVAGDVADPATADACVEVATDTFGGIDVLVNNAGNHAEPNLVHELAIDEIDRFLAINLRGPFLMMRAAIPSMLERGAGAIVNVSSIFGLIGSKYASTYCATKGGLVQLTRAAALDYAADGITVNCICPGLMEPVERAQTTPEQLERLLETWAGPPIGRAATTTEAAELIMHLAGPFGGSITGAIIPIDGGYVAR